MNSFLLIVTCLKAASLYCFLSSLSRYRLDGRKTTQVVAGLVEDSAALVAALWAKLSARAALRAGQPAAVIQVYLHRQVHRASRDLA